MKKILSGILSIVAIFSFVVVAHAATTVVVTGDTSAGENQPGWLFNRDTSTKTPFEFNTDAASIGSGSLYVEPIGSNPSDKFIAENFLATPVSDVNSIAFDYKIAGSGDTNDSDQFYVNVYANIDNSNNYYDCRYDYVASGGSTSDFTTFKFNATDTPTNVVKRSTGRLSSCPATLAEMQSGSYIRMFSISVGDTSVNDQGLAGYLDNVVVDTNSDVVTYDFEPELSPESKEDCKDGGWETFNSPAFKNQGACVSSVASQNGQAHKNK